MQNTSILVKHWHGQSIIRWRNMCMLSESLNYHFPYCFYYCYDLWKRTLSYYPLDSKHQVKYFKKAQWHAIRPKRNLLYSWRHHKIWKKSKGIRQKPRGIRLNKEKLETNKDIIVFMGHQRRSEDRRREDHHNREHEITN